MGLISWVCSCIDDGVSEMVMNPVHGCFVAVAVSMSDVLLSGSVPYQTGRRVEVI